METGMTKRTLIGSAAAAFGAFVIGGCSRTGAAVAAETFEVTKTADEWRAVLTPEQYAVLREENTERAGTSPLNKEQRRGTYVCAGCALPVYTSEAKFESGTGWPSFTAPIAGAVRTKEDRVSWALAPKFIAAAAAGISATSLTTARRRRVSATA
jgi:peptide-methionine (R)-S-oxide reductase